MCLWLFTSALPATLSYLISREVLYAFFLLRLHVTPFFRVQYSQYNAFRWNTHSSNLCINVGVKWPPWQYKYDFISHASTFDWGYSPLDSLDSTRISPSQTRMRVDERCSDTQGHFRPYIDKINVWWLFQLYFNFHRKQYMTALGKQ